MSGPPEPTDAPPSLHERAMLQIQEERALAERRAAVWNWVVVPLTLIAFVAGAVLSFSEDLEVALVANLVASGLGYLLYRLNRDRIRALFGAA